MPTLTAIVPATNSPTTLDRCLAAIEQAIDPPEEVIVVREPADAGPAEARNAGARRARGEVLVFVDADVVIHPDVFTRVRAAFSVDPRLTAVFGSYDDEPPALGLVSRFRNLLHHHTHQRGAGPAATFWAGLGAVRRARFLEAGGFDAARFRSPHVEDIELGMRLTDAGDHVRLDHEMLGTHLKRWTLASMVATDLGRRGVPWVAMLLRRGSSSAALNLSWGSRLNALAWAGTIVAATARRPRAAACLLAALAVGNRSLYALFWRKLGPLRAPGAAALHCLHGLTSLAALPAGVVAYVREQRREGGPLIPQPRTAALRPLWEIGPVTALARNGQPLSEEGLACVVLSLGAEPGLEDAVRSLLEQEPRPTELVVVNSGGGDAAARLAAAGLDVEVIEHEERLYPGGARNAGIAATRSRFVAFLAADCMAEPGWVAGRLRAHRAGAPTVSSAMTNATPTAAGAASHLLLHSRRMPDAPARDRILFGRSYHRELFERVGGFRADLRDGEDSDLNSRLGGGLLTYWAPEVRTAHRNPATLGALMRDQYERGRRTRLYRGMRPLRLARVLLVHRVLHTLRQTMRTRDPAERRALLAAWPLVIPAALAYAAGFAVGRRSEVLGHARRLPPEEPEADRQHGGDDQAGGHDAEGPRHVEDGRRRGVDHDVAHLGEDRGKGVQESELPKLGRVLGDHVQDRRGIEEQLGEDRPELADVAKPDVER